MTIAPTLQNYLDTKHVQYDLVTHEPTMSSLPTARASHIPDDCLAKGVVLRRRDGYALAILPASQRVQLDELRARFGEDIDLATEQEINQLFPDCANGAVPPIAECYGLDALVEDSLREQPDIYLESGDHQTLIHMSQAEFARLTASAPHGHFGTRH